MPGFTVQEIARRFQPLLETAVPMSDCATSRLLAAELGRAWCSFLWRVKTKAPKVMLSYLCDGVKVGEYYPDAKLAVALDRLEAWIPSGRQAFLVSDAKFFWTCPILTDRQYRKHWAPAGSPRAKVQADSRRRQISIFFPEIQPETVRRGLWLAMAKFFDDFRDRAVRFVAVDFRVPVGFALGRESSIVLFDIDHSAGHAHAYPIPEADVGDRLFADAANFNLDSGWLFAPAAAAAVTITPNRFVKVYRPRQPSFERDGYQIDPALDLIADDLKTGSIVKLAVASRASNRQKSHDGLWAIIARQEGPYYIGVIDNNSEFAASFNLLKVGDEIAFLRSDVIRLHPESLGHVPREKLEAYFATGRVKKLH